jgi:hypothetical protein
MRVFMKLPFLLLPAFVIVFGQHAVAKTDQTIRAFSVWQTSGQVPPISGDGVFEDTISGLFYVDTEKGPVAAGTLSCKAHLEVKADKTQTGSADCTITTKDGAQVFGKLACSGVFMVGCSGDLTFTGGSGRFQGVSGGGGAVIRSEFADLPQQANADMTTAKSGIIYFAKLRYQLP